MRPDKDSALFNKNLLFCVRRLPEASEGRHIFIPLTSEMSRAPYVPSYSETFALLKRFCQVFQLSEIIFEENVNK